MERTGIRVWAPVAALEQVAWRFPAAFLLGIANAGFVLWAVYETGTAANVPLALLYASGLGIVLSAVAQVAGELRGVGSRAALASQGAVLVAFVLLAWRFLAGEGFEEDFCVPYYLTLAAFVALFVWLLGCVQRRENVFLLTLFAGMVALAAAVCAGGGVSLVTVAVEKLFGVEVGWRFYSTVWGAAFACVGTEFFLAYATRREAFVVPKVFRVLLLYVLFPVYLVLLAVLWAYLGKCMLAWALPNGQVNWLVTLAATGWMFFHLSLAPFGEVRAVRAFRRFGAALLLPLIVMQIAAVLVRVSAYGLTPARYGSVLFIVFSVAFAVLVSVRACRWSGCAYLVFAALALFAAHSPWNVVDVGVTAQVRRIERIYREAGLFADGKIVPDGAEEKLSAADKKRVGESFRFVYRYHLVDGRWRWGNARSYDTMNSFFRREYGFALPKRDGAANARKWFSHHAETPIDVSAYGKMWSVSLRWRDGRLGLTADGSSTPLDSLSLPPETLAARIDQAGGEKGAWTVTLSDGRVLHIAALSIGYVRTASGAVKIESVYGSGFVFETRTGNGGR